MTLSAKFPSDYDEMEFEIVEEGWNEYELSDGVRIKGRVFLAKIIRDPNNLKNMNFDVTQPKWSIYAPVELRGPPSTELLKDSQRQNACDKYNVHIDRSHEPWNVYRILRTGQKVKIKLTIDEIIRLQDAFDPNGSPFYRVPHGISVLVKGNKPEQGP